MLDRSLLLHHLARGQPKAKVARDLLAKFVVQRPDDRFALMFFSTKPLSVVSFTQHDEVVQAGIAAADIGRGLANDRGWPRAAGGDRRIRSTCVLGKPDHPARFRRRRLSRRTDAEAGARGAGSQQDRLYWIYLRSYNAPALDNSEPGRENAPEIALHNFFQTLRTPYRAYQAEVPEDLEKAVADVGRQQNFPLDFLEEVPRQDYSRRFIAAAAICCLLLLLGPFARAEKLGMRRRTVHGFFGAVAGVCAALAIWYGVQLTRANRINAAIASANAAPIEAAAAASSASTPDGNPTASSASTPNGSPAASSASTASDTPDKAPATIPQAQLAHAISLAKAGKFTAALKAYKSRPGRNR